MKIHASVWGVEVDVWVRVPAEVAHLHRCSGRAVEDSGIEGDEVTVKFDYGTA